MELAGAGIAGAFASEAAAGLTEGLSTTIFIFGIWWNVDAIDALSLCPICTPSSSVSEIHALIFS